MFPVNGLAKEEGKEGRKRFLAALEMTAWGMAIPCIIQRMCRKSVLPVSSSRAESRGLFRWRQEGERLTARNGKHPYHGKWKRRVSRIVILSEVEGSFSLAVRRSVFDSEERETPCRGKAGAVLPVNSLAKKSGKKGTKKISRCARNDSVGDGYPVHHTKNVWEMARFPYRHPERSRGIFFIGGKTESV